MSGKLPPGKIAPPPPIPPLRVRVWFRIRVRIRVGEQFSAVKIVLEPG